VGNDLKCTQSCSIPVSVKAAVHGDQQQMSYATSADMDVCLKFSINSDASDVTVCSKCIQLMDQLEYSRMELKSLQLTTKLFENDNVQSNTEPLVESYNAVHFIIAYGIIFWGISPYSNNIFKLQKRAIRIIMNAGNRVSCRGLFKKLNILPLHSQYILSLLLFVVKNIEEFTSNSEVHSINTCHRSDLYPPSIKLTKYKKGVYYSGIKIFSHLPQNIKNLS
jgi:hypothetical protein